MSIWVVVWMVLSAILLYFTAWTILVLQKQKKGWYAFAKKYKLRYQPNSFLESPSMSGVIDEHTVGIFVGIHASEDARRARKLSAIEITMENRLPTDGAVATSDMVYVVDGLNFKSEIKPQHPDWSDEYVAATNNKSVLQSYLTPERLDHLMKLAKIKNGAVIFIFRGDVMLLRFDTPEPLEKPQMLDKLVKQMIEAAKVLEFSDDLPIGDWAKHKDDALTEADKDKEEDA